MPLFDLSKLVATSICGRNSNLAYRWSCWCNTCVHIGWDVALSSNRQHQDDHFFFFVTGISNLSCPTVIGKGSIPRYTNMLVDVRSGRIRIFCWDAKAFFGTEPSRTIDRVTFWYWFLWMTQLLYSCTRCSSLWGPLTNMVGIFFFRSCKKSFFRLRPDTVGFVSRCVLLRCFWN